VRTASNRTRKAKRAPHAPREETGLFRRLNWEISAEAVIAGGAFFLSLTTAIVQIILTVRGPVISVRPPDRAVLYRDGTQSGAVLELALRTTMLNSASGDNGDLVDKAQLTLETPGAKAVTFPFDSLVKIHLVDNPTAAVEHCDVDARCLALTGLVVVDHGERLIDLPAGRARTDFLTFGLARSACGANAACAPYADFESAARWLDNRPIIAKLKLSFVRAADRTLECESRPLNGRYLQHVGWLSFTCQSSGRNP
jgi:hypothetical protein